MATSIVYFAHGQESGPWGTKITALAEIAKAKGLQVESPDYSFTQDADERVDHLVKLNPKPDGKLILVGSSMGGYVSTVASVLLNVDGLFLLAPAFFIPEYKLQDPAPKAKFASIIHGWHDDVVPLDHSIRYAQEHDVDLHILNSDHRLASALPTIEKLFTIFLDQVLE